MSQEDLIKRSLIACIKGTTVGGALLTTPGVGYLKGCVGARTGTGVVTITLDPSASFDSNVAVNESMAEITLGTTNVTCSIVDTSQTTKTLSFFSTVTPTVAVEAAFEVRIYRIYPS